MSRSGETESTASKLRGGVPCERAFPGEGQCKWRQLASVDRTIGEEPRTAAQRLYEYDWMVTARQSTAALTSVTAVVETRRAPEEARSRAVAGAFE